MDQPSGILGEIQPQDVSPSDIPPVIDLPGKPEECSTAQDALQSVRSSSWCPNTSDPGLQFSDSSSSDIAIQPRDQNQLNNTLSHTTVTLSYISRSHVFSSNCVSQPSPLFNIPPISKLSLHSHCGSESHLSITDYSKEQVQETKYLPTQKERLLPQGQAGQACRAGGFVTQQYLELNGDGFRKESVSDVENQCRFLKDCKSLENDESKSSRKRQASQMKKSRSGDVSTSASELNKTKASICSVAWKLPLVGMAQKKPVLPLRTSTVQCRRKTPPQSGLQTAANRNSKRAPQLLSQSGVSAEVTVPSLSLPQPESPKNQDNTKSREVPPASKKKVSHTPKRRRRKTKPSHTYSMFSPKEPEIKLKYVGYKEEKRDSKLDLFSPFIRVEQKQSLPSLCSVINYPEEVKVQQKLQLHTNTCGFVSAVMPSTSCLHLGRPSIHSQHQRAFICCLCGHPANAMDLGDLHGPYYPEGLRPSSKTATSTSGLKEEEEDFSDSDSSSFGMRASRRKSVAPHTPWSVRNQLKQNMEHRRRAGNGTKSPAAKRVRLVAGSSDSQDWCSPPILPLEPCEYWLHEDCSIWSAGVFLVKGRVYGLEEAVKIAHEMMCSGCQHSGATLGCIFKGCPNKYHYRCALEADCMLIEENFSMKCKKHKNKTLKAPLGNQWNGR